MRGIGACPAPTLLPLLAHLLQFLKRLALGLLLLLRLFHLLIFNFLVFFFNLLEFLVLAVIFRCCIFSKEECIYSYGYNREDQDESC